MFGKQIFTCQVTFLYDMFLLDWNRPSSLFFIKTFTLITQIYISYGQKSNAELLLLYGFALERNPYNSVDVTVSIAPRTAKLAAANEGIDEDPLAQEKIDFLESVGRDQTVDFPCYADRYPVEMLEYLRLMMMTPEDTRWVSHRHLVTT